MIDNLIKTIKIAEYLDIVEEGTISNYYHCNDEKIVVLGKLLDINSSNLHLVEEIYKNTYGYNGEEYLILTEYDAEDYYWDYWENYYCDIIESEIPDHLIDYFDKDKWIDHAIRDGDRGNALASYDGVEHEEYYERTYYLIYRTN